MTSTTDNPTEIGLSDLPDVVLRRVLKYTGKDMDVMLSISGLPRLYCLAAPRVTDLDVLPAMFPETISWEQFLGIVAPLDRLRSFYIHEWNGSIFEALEVEWMGMSEQQRRTTVNRFIVALSRNSKLQYFHVRPELSNFLADEDWISLFSNNNFGKLKTVSLQTDPAAWKFLPGRLLSDIVRGCPQLDKLLLSVTKFSNEDVDEIVQCIRILSCRTSASLEITCSSLHPVQLEWIRYESCMGTCMHVHFPRAWTVPGTTEVLLPGWRKKNTVLGAPPRLANYIPEVWLSRHNFSIADYQAPIEHDRDERDSDEDSGVSEDTNGENGDEEDPGDGDDSEAMLRWQREDFCDFFGLDFDPDGGITLPGRDDDDREDMLE